MSTLDYWNSNINYKQRILTHMFGACLVCATISCMLILTFGTLTMDDIALIPLLLLTLLAAFPYVEVAVKTNTSSITPNVLTVTSYKKHIYNKSSKYTILTSRLGVFQPIYAALCIISFLLVCINKVLGDDMINKKTVAGLLILQVPFNPLLGFNPIPVRLLRMPESRFVTQNTISQSVASYQNTRFSPDVTPQQDIMNTSTRIELRNKPPKPASNSPSNDKNKGQNENKELLSIFQKM